ncbi:hypothetical protein F4801DRAFT_520271 [Xylaria longipes]|nr:hypothetical protein F4801DRAFT_520271 [Xylaria longipes]
MPIKILEPFSHPPTAEPDGNSKREIEFLHPGYGYPHNILFILPRLNYSPFCRGVHYGTALTACQIIANNAFDGYLAIDREGRERVNPDPVLNFDFLLTKPYYWFFVDSAP